MPKTIELTVPDLGGFEDVPIIEIMIASGDTIGKDAPLVTLESDKATMEVPATFAGIIREIKVKLGDRVSPGTILADVEVADDAPASSAPAAAAPAQTSAAPAPAPAPAAAAPKPDAGEITDTASLPSAATDVTTELIVPDLGGFDDVPVISIFIKAGDTIAKDAALVELESDKATMEVPALVGGLVREIRVSVGDRVSPGTVLATVGTPVTTSAPAPPVATAPPVAAAPPAPAAPTTSAASPAPATPPAPVSPAPALAAIVAPAPPSHNGSANGASSAASNGASNGVANGPVHASPAIRRFARELGVTLGSVSGSGPNGRITRDDVQQHVKRALAAPANPPPAQAAAPAGAGLTLLPWPKIDFEKFGPVERQPLSRIAKLSGQNLARNWVLIPHVTQYEDADVTELEAFRKTINAEHKDVKVTMLALLMKALIASLRQYPQFNSSLDGDDLILKRYYNLGFAADTPNGLVVPVIRNVDTKGVLELAGESSALAKKARDGKLSPADMSGAGFTISSLGGIGGTAFTPIINAPEVAILGVSRTTTKPVWNGTTFMPRLILPLSLSYDHRVIDGALAARFITHLAGVLADMRKTLL